MQRLLILKSYYPQDLAGGVVQAAESDRRQFVAW